MGNLSASLGRRKLGKCSKVTSKWKMGFQRAADSFDVPYLCSWISITSWILQLTACLFNWYEFCPWIWSWSLFMSLCSVTYIVPDLSRIWSWSKSENESTLYVHFDLKRQHMQRFWQALIFKQLYRFIVLLVSRYISTIQIKSAGTYSDLWCAYFQNTFLWF
jgi:hypothetical protein